MRIGRAKVSRETGLQHHIDALAATARMEMDLEVGDWRETLSQLHELMDQVTAQSRSAQTETEHLIAMMRQRISRLEAVIRRREREYDALQEETCRKVDQAYLQGRADESHRTG